MNVCGVNSHGINAICTSRRAKIIALLGGAPLVDTSVSRGARAWPTLGRTEVREPTIDRLESTVGRLTVKFQGMEHVASFDNVPGIVPAVSVSGLIPVDELRVVVEGIRLS